MILPLVVAALAALLLLLAGPGVRLDLWSFRTGFDLLKWAAYLGLAGAALGVVQLVVPRWRLGHVRGLVLAVVLGLAVAGVPWYWRRLANQVPPIHDISTDTTDPPAFVALRDARMKSPNGVDYKGAEVAAQQQQVYADIKPAVIPQPPREALQPRGGGTGSRGHQAIGRLSLKSDDSDRRERHDSRTSRCDR